MAHPWGLINKSACSTAEGQARQAKAAETEGLWEVSVTSILPRHKLEVIAPKRQWKTVKFEEGEDQILYLRFWEPKGNKKLVEA